MFGTPVTPSRIDGVKLVLITGAGASRDLGAGRPLPLMGDWSSSLALALEGQEVGLAKACQLMPGDGPTFEKNLGLLLQWERDSALHERFLTLGGVSVGSYDSNMTDYLNRMKSRLSAVKATLDRNLYDLFGQERIDDDAAQRGYQALFDALGDPDLMVATTNYDRSIEAALGGMGRPFKTGFVRRGERTPVLRPEGLVREQAPGAVVLHLHGAVGWYDTGTQVEDHLGDKAFNASLGTPVVLYPDPDKDPTEHRAVSQLWTEFREALAWSDHVLVLGHGLNDPALLRELKAVSKRTKIAVARRNEEGLKAVRKEIPNATGVMIDFGPTPQIDRAALEDWRDS
jgi:hypothetical protein